MFCLRQVFTLLLFPWFHERIALALQRPLIPSLSCWTGDWISCRFAASGCLGSAASLDTVELERVRRQKMDGVGDQPESARKQPTRSSRRGNRKLCCVCRNHRPGTWSICSLCRVWMGRGCDPERCLIVMHWAQNDPRTWTGTFLCHNCFMHYYIMQDSRLGPGPYVDLIKSFIGTSYWPKMQRRWPKMQRRRSST